MLVCCSSITVHQQHCSSLSSSFPSTTSSIIYQSARSFLACSPTCLLPPDIYNWFSIANNNHAHTAAYDSSTPPLLFPIIIICCPQKPNISRAVFPFPHSHIPGGTPQSPASPSLVDRTGASSACPTATKQFDGSTRRTNTALRKDEKVKNQKHDAQRIAPRRGYDRVLPSFRKVLDFLLFEGRTAMCVRFHLLFSSLSTSFSSPSFSLYLFLATTLYRHETNWQDQTDLLIKPVPHLQHYLPSSIYILEDSLVDFRHQDKKAAGSCFGHQ